MITTCITDTAAHTWEQHACSSAYNRKLMITTAQPTLPPTPGSSAHVQASALASSVANCWAEAPIKIARMTLTIKLDGNWSSFQLANSTPPLSVTDSAIAPSARVHLQATRPKPRSTTQRSRTASYARVLFNAERQRRKEQHPS